MVFNTKQLIEALTGTNKAFIKRVSKHQEEKYGNVDIFEAVISRERDWFRGDCVKVNMMFGDYHIDFFIDDYRGCVIDTNGNGQGHRYHESLQACAMELWRKYRNERFL